ncbi:MAG TPA: Flp family type IVb pilin [Dehalococcoidia bacterium]|nr:Flp family type IVb pilin [Dehalococcoidia bacterium]
MSIIDRVFVQFLTAVSSRKDEEGQGLAEYGLILALIAVVCVAALTLLGNKVSGVLSSVAGSI